MNDEIREMIQQLHNEDSKLPLQTLVRHFGLSAMATAEKEGWIDHDGEFYYFLTEKGRLHLLAFDCDWFRIRTSSKDESVKFSIGHAADVSTIYLSKSTILGMVDVEIESDRHRMPPTDFQAMIDIMQHWLGHVVQLDDAQTQTEESE